MSKKRITLCVAFVALLFSQCAGLASAYEGNASEAGGGLKFYTDGTDVVLTSSNTVELNNDQDVNVILAVYDNSRLIKTIIKTVDAGTTEYSVDNLRIHLSDVPENPTVKLLVWSADDKIVPQAEARVPDRMDSVSFKAKEVADDSSIGKNYTEYKKIPVYKSAQSALTYKYVLSEDNSGNVNTTMYVNGYSAGIVTNTLIENYILGNSNGTVTLVDYDSDGKYDRMDVSCTVDAVVDSVEISDGRVIINLLAGGYGAIEDENGSVSYAPISWDADNTAVKLIKNGKQIEYTELHTYDVLTVSYDVFNSDGDPACLEGAEIYVSDETISGTVTSRDTSDYTIRIGGTDYNVNENVADICAIDLSGYYIVYLNMYGQAVYFEKDVTKNNYGVIVAMYESAGRDAPVVRLVTPDGDVVAYECWNHSEADKFYNYATGTSSGYKSSAFTKSALRERIITGQTVCTYKLSGGKIRFGEACIGVGGSGLEYKASSGMLGSYAVSDTTKLIDMEDYMRPSSGSSEVVSVSVSAFEDQAIYDAYLFGRNGRGVYCFAIVFNGLVALPEQSPEPEITGMGIIVAMYQSAGKDYPTVSLVTADGEVVAYECKDRSAADQFYNYATGTSSGYKSSAFTKSALRERIITGQTVCT
ncbi:MAG: hypothetical protein PUD92_01040, partial [Clostridiales bacterium]|nr:hypothetical protein [Clostridiales bacterium]